MNAEAVTEGRPYPLGATVTKRGVNFALFSAHASAVELCLFDQHGQRETARIRLEECTDQVWHAHVDGVAAGTRYGYRVHGPYDPGRGHRFNPAKLLIDPYARQLDRPARFAATMLAYDAIGGNDRKIDDVDSAADVPKAIVKTRSSAAEIEAIQARKPHLPWSETVIYEAHVRGMTMTHPDVPQDQRGTFRALTHGSIIGHLQALGVTAIELLPIQGFLDEPFLTDKGLTNYWGYNTLTFFAPHAPYLHGSDPDEFRAVVEELHGAGIEVILDVVYNHTCEGNQLGPTLSLRGIDNASYYRLAAQDARHYVNDTGCGNTINAAHPRVLQLILDSLRFWAGEMGVDGFRFDLASALGRESHGFDPGAGFFDAIAQDPLLATCKLIAEPWDIGPGGYQLGQYPAPWSEWNDRFRDTVRRFWRGDAGQLADFARRIHGSSDIFEHSGRAPRASVNLITSHDGFTLHDLVTYEERHNEANGEDNRDGHHANFSDNCGVEGETDDPRILETRRRQRRNLLATLILSQGVPMLLAGDELGRSQRGNNNAYCQDNPISWIDWQALWASNHDLLDFTRYLIDIRRRHPILTASTYIHQANEVTDRDYYCMRWINRDGEPMPHEQWMERGQRTVGWIAERNELCTRGERVVLLTLFNASPRSVDIRLPAEAGVSVWSWLLDTQAPTGIPDRPRAASRSVIDLPGLSMALLSGG